MTYQIRKANRGEAKPLVGLYAQSGAGKTWSSLLLARGFCGPKGHIVMIETEGGRGEAFGDLIEGGYDVLSMRDDFAPAKFGQAISLVEAAHPDVLIIDSASHEWSGAGGVLDMAAENQKKFKGPLVWQKPKMDHARHFMLRVLQTPVRLVILCMRAKYPMREIKKPDGTKEWVRSELLDPDQAADILFEMFVHGWIDQEHRLHVTKLTRPDLADVFRDNEPITLTTGERLAAWAKGLPVVVASRPQATEPAGATTATAAHVSAGSLSVADMAREAAMRGRVQLRAYCRTLVGASYVLVTQTMHDELEALIPKEDAKQ
jgi:hypothetical protein